MEYVGYAIINGTEMESHRITQVQGASQTFVLQFDEAQLQLPIVTTSPVTDITDTTAICGGNVSADGGSAITSRGLCWNTTGNPTMASHSIPMGDSLGAFSYCITGLLPNTTYYVRAYAVNSVGVKYGDVKSFTTSYDAQLPVVTTNPVTNVTDTTALCGGTVFGASISAKGVCWSTSPMPTIAAFHTDNGNGTGNFTSILSGLQEGTTYYIRSYATNHIGTSYGNELTFTTFSENNNGLPCIGTPTLTDYDGNVYATVQIGIQCWMKENLRTTHFANGTAIPTNDHTSASVPYRYCPNNNVANVPEYGYLYNWKAVMHQSSSSNANPSEVQGVCPIGWHVPSNVEWTQLANFLNTHDEYLCDSTSNAIAKALASTTGWTNYTGDDPDKTCYPGFNPSDNDASGFYAKPAGIFGSYASTFKSRVMFWTATDFSTTEACYRSIHNNNNFLISSEADKTYGFSVRCVRD